MVDADVLIVGAGPVGESLLVLLADRGISAIAFEREPEVWPLPRAVHFDGETMRTFQAIGLGDAVAEVTAPMLNYRMVNLAGDVLVDLPTGRLGPEGWIEAVMFHQPDFDSVVRDRIAGSDIVKILPGTTVESYTQDADIVTVSTIGPNDERRDFSGRFLVGADGASSTVRRAMGVRYDELGPNNPWLVVDGIFREEPAESYSMVFYGSYERPRIWAALPGMRRRMEFKVMPGDDVDQIGSPEWVAEETDGLMTPDNFDIERSTVYTFRSTIAPKWRDGRVFLAGDAAHLAPPLFGQGLCSGIRDAANLAWKFDLVLRGASMTLLDTYESERLAHARAWVEQATRMSEIVQATVPQIAAGRDQHIKDHPEEGGVPPAPRLGDGFHTGEGLAGFRIPQPQLDGGARFDDAVGTGFLVTGSADLIAALPGDIRQRFEESGLVTILDDSSPGVSALLEAVGAPFAIVRPDRYLYGAATSADSAVALAREVSDVTLPRRTTRTSV